MEKLSITKNNALKAYQAADPYQKKLLEYLFEPGTFSPRPVTERISEFEDVLADQNITVEQFKRMTENDTDDEVAYKKLKLIACALNEGWVPDWTNSNEYKWWPYFKYTAGFGFSCTLYGGWSSGALVGSRLVFKTKELAVYAAEQFKDIYNDYLTIQ